MCHTNLFVSLNTNKKGHTISGRAAAQSRKAGNALIIYISRRPSTLLMIYDQAVMFFLFLTKLCTNLQIFDKILKV